MRSPIRAFLRVMATIALLMTAGARGAAIQDEFVPPNTESPGSPEIARALEKVKADPNLATERTIKTLHWKDSNDAKQSGMPAWLTWIIGLFRWVDQSSRILLWGTAVALAGVLVVYIVRLVRTHRGARCHESFVAPTHVRDLDIRPESLPQDIGVAARLLWDRGEHRVALALLYRGLLSRLAHVHRIPIRDCTTEGDCLALAASHLTQARHEYTSRLVRVWQRSVYGGEDARAATVYVLCDDFASALDRSPVPDSLTRGATS